MASKSFRFCNYPACNEPSRGRYCEKHQAVMNEKRADDKARYDKTREKTKARGYDADWVRCRDAYLSAHQLCEACEKAGRLTPAILVHHKRALSEQGKRLDPDNLMSLCTACHEAIHGPDRWQKR